MERGLLSDPKLAKFYDQVVWMYLYQDILACELGDLVIIVTEERLTYLLSFVRYNILKMVN